MFDFIKKLFIVKTYTVSSVFERDLGCFTDKTFYFNGFELCVSNVTDDRHVTLKMSKISVRTIHKYEVHFETCKPAKLYVSNFTISHAELYGAAR